LRQSSFVAMSQGVSARSLRVVEFHHPSNSKVVGGLLETGEKSVSIAFDEWSTP